MKVTVQELESCEASANTARLTIRLRDAAGQQLDIELAPSVASQLVLSLHQVCLKLADRSRNGALQSGQVQVFEPQSVETGFAGADLVVLFDRGLPSEANYRLTVDHSWRLGQAFAAWAESQPGKHQSSRQ